MTKFNVASIILCTEIEGPYKRLAIWFQGCNVFCDGCCNPDYQAIVSKHILSLEDLVEIVADSKTRFQIEGVTYSGGEPTLQKGLPLLTAEIKKMGLGVISFTGHLYKDVKEELSGCDIVIDGPYKKSLADNERRLIGSRNQRIVYLTDRYRDKIDWWTMGDDGKKVEVNVGESIFTNGDKW